MKPLSEEVPFLLVFQIQIQAVCITNYLHINLDLLITYLKHRPWISYGFVHIHYRAVGRSENPGGEGK